MIELSDNKITLEIKDITRDLAIKILSDNDDLPKETELSLFRLLLAPDFRYMIVTRYERQYEILHSYDKKIMAKLIDECVRLYVSAYHNAHGYRRTFGYFDSDTDPIFLNMEHISRMERFFLLPYEKRVNEYRRLNTASIFKNGAFRYNDDPNDDEIHHWNYGIPIRLIPEDVIRGYMDKVPVKTITITLKKIVEETYTVQTYDDEETIFGYNGRKLDDIINDEHNVLDHKTEEYRTHDVVIGKPLNKKDIYAKKNIIESESAKMEE
jgi:hypothetical protein